MPNPKVAIITGSSQGIGKAIAIKLAQEGYSIVLNGRNTNRLKEAESAIKAIHSRVLSICADVSNEEEANSLIEQSIQHFGRIDILVNNVGISMRGNLAELNPSVFRSVFNSNVFGTVNSTIPALPHLRETQGSVVFISSLAGIRGLPFLSAYSSSKMALTAIAESIRIEERDHGIHVGLIYVGITDIEHHKETIAADGSMKVLKTRDKNKVQSTTSVAEAVYKNIIDRKFITTLTTLGKLNRFLQALFPSLVERIILSRLDEFREKSQ